MGSTAVAEVWQPCDAWDKPLHPTNFKKCLARLIVWFIFPVNCFCLLLFAARLQGCETSDPFALTFLWRPGDKHAVRRMVVRASQ